MMDRVFRTLELLGGLSLVTDIGTGSPLEESLKRCLVAARLARMIGCNRFRSQRCALHIAAAAPRLYGVFA